MLGQSVGDQDMHNRASRASCSGDSAQTISAQTVCMEARIQKLKRCRCGAPMFTWGCPYQAYLEKMLENEDNRGAYNGCVYN